MLHGNIYQGRKWHKALWFFSPVIFFWLTYFFSQPSAILSEKQQHVALFASVFLSVLSSAGAIFFCSEKFIINDETIEHKVTGISCKRKLVDIKFISVDWTPGSADTFPTQIYKLESRNRRQLALIGPWIKNYRQLLRDIITRVPPDCVVDAEVLAVIKKP